MRAKGSLWRALDVTPCNFASLPERDQDHAAALWGALLNALSPGQVLWVIVENRARSCEVVLAELLEALNPTAAGLQAFAEVHIPWLERSLRARHVADLSFTLFVESKDQERMLSGVDLAKTRPDQADDLALAALELQVQRVQGALLGMNLASTPTPAERVRALTSELPVARETPAYLQLADGRVCASRYLFRPPPETDPGWLAPLLSLPCETRVVLSIEGTQGTKQRKALGRKLSQLHAAQTERLRSGVRPNLYAAEAATEYEETLSRLRRVSTRVLKYGVAVTVFASEAQALAGHLAALQTTAQFHAIELASGLFAQQPLAQSGRGRLGRSAPLPRYHYLTGHVENSVPFITRSPGQARGVPVGRVGSELVLLDPFSDTLPNSLFCVIGKTSSGKTVFALKMLLWTLLRGGRGTVVAKAGHYAPLAELAGGHVCTFLSGAEGADAINMWEIFTKPADLVTMHRVMLELDGADYTALAVLDAGIQGVLHDARRSGRVPLERDLVEWLTLIADDDTGGEEEWRTTARRLQRGLGRFVGEGEFATIIDRPTSVPLDTPLLVFDLSRLKGSQAAAAMTLIAGVVDRRTSFDARRARGHEDERECLVIDEGWFITEYAGGSEWIEELQRTGRHRGLYSIFLSQDFRRLYANAVAVSVVNSAAGVVLFRQSEGLNRETQERFHLSADDMTTLDGLSRTKRVSADALFRLARVDSPQPASSIVSIELSPAEAFLMASNPDEQITRTAWCDAAGGDLARAVVLATEGGTRLAPDLPPGMRASDRDPLTARAEEVA
jgi:hypothetical protein